jgi:hypothetical protein
MEQWKGKCCQSTETSNATSIQYSTGTYFTYRSAHSGRKESIDPSSTGTGMHDVVLHRRLDSLDLTTHSWKFRFVTDLIIHSCFDLVHSCFEGMHPPAFHNKIGPNN